MSKPGIADMNEEMARAFATDAYRQMTEVTQQRDEFRAICELHVREHDAARETGGRCTCTLCKRTEQALQPKSAQSCSVCGYAADGQVEGVYYCVRCLAEHKACEQEYRSDTRLDR